MALTHALPIKMALVVELALLVATHSAFQGQPELTNLHGEVKRVVAAEKEKDVLK